MDNIITENIKGIEIKFKTMPGVFSKKGLDLGSRLIAENLEAKNGSLIADLGCGSGVIGFIIAKQNPQSYVHLLDVDLRTVNLAKENTQLNDLKNVEVILSDLFSAVSNRSYHLIVSNPPQHIGNKFLQQSAKECFNHLKPEGEVFWVVQKRISPYIKRLFDKTFGNCKIVAKGLGYTILKAVKHGKA